MADNQDNLSFGNFGIQDTMEMGMGNQQLLNDLLGAETSTANPDEIKDIKDETPATPVKKTAADKALETSTEDTTKVNSIQDFLLGEDDDDDDDDETKTAAAKPADTAQSSTETSDDDPEVSRFGALSNDLFKLGVFNKEEGEEDVAISTPEEFLERFNLEKKKGAIEVVNNFIGQFGEDYQQAFDAIFVKGVDPKDYFGAFNNIQDFTNLDLAVESNQIAVLKQALSEQGFETEDVTTEIERLKNYGDLESVAAKHHKVLIKKEAAKLQQMEQQREQQLQQQAQVKQKYIANVQTVLQEKLKAKEFDGIPINPKLAGELQDFLVTDRYKTPSGEMLTEFDRTILDLKRPENHSLKVKVGLLLKILEKDPTLSTIQKSGVTKKTDSLFSEVVKQSVKSGVKDATNKTQPTSWFK